MAERATHRLEGKTGFWVYYEDTDFSGFVYHANYLKFFERAREHLLGIENLRDLFAQGIHFVVAKASIDFLKPACHGEWLDIESSCDISRSPSVIFTQRAVRNGETLVSATIHAVCLNDANRPIRVPDAVIRALTS